MFPARVDLQFAKIVPHGGHHSPSFPRKTKGFYIGSKQCLNPALPLVAVQTYLGLQPASVTTSSGQVAGKPGSTAAGGAPPRRKPLADVTHLYYPSAQNKKVHGVRAMR